MQFALYYVLWPFIGGAGFCYFGLMQPEYVWWFLGIWFLPWIAWPVGTYRRRYLNTHIWAFTEEAEKSGEASWIGALALMMGPPIIMVLSGMLGTYLAPVLMEEVLGIDVPARIEEIQKNVEGP